MLEYETKKFIVAMNVKGRFGDCIRLTAKGKHNINQDDIEEFLHNERGGEYFVTVHIGREEWHPHEGADVAELYDLGMIVEIAKAVEEE